ncbi:MAG TPA: hypothetical protein VL088_03940 [Pedobacter sp.]|jgi:hypothetical protein|nr:hypothetical protein [Pedobacter sp.]
MTKQTKLVTGLLAGAALGTALVLVLTSDKNSALKGKLNDWVGDMLTSSKDKLDLVANLVKGRMTKIEA